MILRTILAMILTIILVMMAILWNSGTPFSFKVYKDPDIGKVMGGKRFKEDINHDSRKKKR